MNIVAGADRCIGRSQTVPGKEPIILRPPGATGWAVTRYVAAAKIRVADPCLIKRDLCPRNRPIHLIVGRLHPQDTVSVLVEMRCGLRAKSVLIPDEGAKQGAGIGCMCGIHSNKDSGYSGRI